MAPCDLKTLRKTNRLRMSKAESRELKVSKTKNAIARGQARLAKLLAEEDEEEEKEEVLSDE